MHESRRVGANSRAEAGNGPTLTYKFQRLREQIRSAVLNGELSGRLPGERELARRYMANAKTVNKALGDLSSEGLLIRLIGRGTFVAERDGAQPTAASSARSFLCLVPQSEDHRHGYRSALTRMLSDRLASKGHQLINVAADPSMRSGDFPASAWPTATRSAVSGLAVYPYEPLSGGVGRLSEECIAEAYRRHVPMVSIGASAGDAKVNAVVPDYADAGFRLAEHLYQSGCEFVLVACGNVEGREVGLVLNGCRAAARRRRCGMSSWLVGSGGATAGPVGLPAFSEGGLGQHGRGGLATSWGLICVGRRVLEVLRRPEFRDSPQVAGALDRVYVLEPGDAMPAQEGLTAYEVDENRLASWAADLLTESKPGQRPIEIIIPGKLNIREASAAASTGRADRPAEERWRFELPPEVGEASI